MIKWAVFISGRGSNLQALMDVAEENRIVLVVSSSARAPGLLKAKRMGIPTWVLPKKIDWSEVNTELRRRGVGRVFLAGFMRLVPASFFEFWPDAILNVHPSLLPHFPGLHAIETSFAAGAEMGVTVHVVTPEMDAGPIVLQKKVLPKRAVQQERAAAIPPLTLAQAEFLISVSEQYVVREAFRRWNFR